MACALILPVRPWGAALGATRLDSASAHQLPRSPIAPTGNHASCLALAASTIPVPCHLVMPLNSAPPKIAAARSYGASITFCPPTAADRQSTLDRVQTETGATFVPPYDARNTILGQGTVWLEVEEQVREAGFELGDVGAVVVPVGGGGLLAGVALAAVGSGVPVYGAGGSRVPLPLLGAH